MPITKKTAMQFENMKKAQPELDKLEKKYKNKPQDNQEIMMQKTQEQLAIKLNISRQSISKWERDVGLPNLTYLKPLSKILKCSIEDLLVF